MKTLVRIFNCQLQPAAVIAAGLLVCPAVGCARVQSTPSGSADAWDQMAVILKRIVPPTFPPRDFVITDFGAVYGHSPRIYARGATNIAITGAGTIDGRGRATLDLMQGKPRGGSGTLRRKR